jgi:translation initiation factor IF-2
VSFEIQRFSAQENIEIKEYKVIYHLLEDIEKAIEGRLKPKEEEKIKGKAVVKALFKSTTGDVIAGCKVTEGLIRLGVKVKVKRENEIVAQGRIKTLHHLKKKIKEVKKGTECGLTIDPPFDFQTKDIILGYGG